MLAKAAGIELSYTRQGQGRPLLLLPDGPELDHTYLRPWLDPLGSQVELIYCHQRGPGSLTRFSGPELSEHDARIAAAEVLRAALGHERLILFGHAYGAFLAQEYALRFGEHLMGLILCSITLPAGHPEGAAVNAALNRLDQITTPTLVIAGRADSISSPIQAERIHATLPHSKLVIFDKSGHFPFMEEHDKFLAVIANWLAGLD